MVTFLINSCKSLLLFFRQPPPDSVGWVVLFHPSEPAGGKGGGYVDSQLDQDQ